MTIFSRLPQVTRVFFAGTYQVFPIITSSTEHLSPTRAGGQTSRFATIAADVGRDKLVFLRNRGSPSPQAMDPRITVLLLEDILADASLQDTPNSITVATSPDSSSAPSPTPPLFSPRLHTSPSTARAFVGREDVLRSPTSHLSEEEQTIPQIDPALVALSLFSENTGLIHLLSH